MSFGSNSHGKYFHRNSNSYFEPRFHLSFVQIFMFFEANLVVMCVHCVVVQTKHMKIIDIFDEIKQKTWFKIWVEILMKIFSMWIAPRQHSWPLRVSAVVSEMIFPRKIVIFAWFFMYVDYCRVSYSKRMHCSSFTSTQWDRFFGGGRAVEVL